MEPGTKGCFRYRVSPEREFKGQMERGEETPNLSQHYLKSAAKEKISDPQWQNDGVSG